MIDKKYQIGVPIVNPEEKMMPSAPAIRKYVSGIQGGRPVEIPLDEEFYYFGEGDLYAYGKVTVPAGTPVYQKLGEDGAIEYQAGTRHYDTKTSGYVEKFATKNFVGVLTDDFVVETKDLVQVGGHRSAYIPASIMTVGSVNIGATGIGASWFAELLAAPYQGIKFESDEVTNNYSQAE